MDRSAPKRAGFAPTRPNRYGGFGEEAPPTESQIRKQAKATKLNAELAQALRKSQKTGASESAPKSNKKKKIKQRTAANAENDLVKDVEADEEVVDEQSFCGAYAVPPSTAAAADDAVTLLDEFGKGNPFDRLQFGYSPAIAAEATAFHAPFVAKDWISQRKKFYTMCIVKKQKLHKANCEPLVTMFKLKRHWQSLSKFDAGLKGDAIDDDEAQQFLDLLAREQQQDQQPTSSTAAAADSSVEQREAKQNGKSARPRSEACAAKSVDGADAGEGAEASGRSGKQKKPRTEVVSVPAAAEAEDSSDE